jgi:hypothetical protein
MNCHGNKKEIAIIIVILFVITITDDVNYEANYGYYGHFFPLQIISGSFLTISFFKISSFLSPFPPNWGIQRVYVGYVILGVFRDLNYCVTIDYLLCGTWGILFFVFYV